MRFNKFLDAVVRGAGTAIGSFVAMKIMKNLADPKKRAKMKKVFNFSKNTFAEEES